MGELDAGFAEEREPVNRDLPLGSQLPNEHHAPADCERRSNIPIEGVSLIQTIEIAGGAKDGQRLAAITLPCGCMALYDVRQAGALGKGMVIAAARLANGVIDTKIKWSKEKGYHA